MDSDPRALRVRIEADGLHLTRGRDAGASTTCSPGRTRWTRWTEPPPPPCRSPRPCPPGSAPVGSAEAVLRGWTRGAPPPYVAFEDPAAGEPVRVRAGAIVIRDGRILLIHFTDEAY
ncbi:MULTISPECIES: hypothetical protein [unclassified Streptomyces]|uniref:hypothetical protein n=1 Tax=unclassified Streptomyces TaxID=2593676 RepID=UPI00331F4F23